MRSFIRAINVRPEDISPVPKCVLELKRWLWNDELLDLQEGFIPVAVPELIKDKWGRIDPELSLKQFEELKADFYRALRKTPSPLNEKEVEICHILRESLKN